MPTVVAVGLGPAGAELMSEAARTRLREATTARLRTRRHPAASDFPDVASFDELYDRAPDFDTLYGWIADELVALATADPHGTVVYAVPGSPSVAERSVARLSARDDVVVVTVPSLSFLDLACVALRIDPVDAGLRLGDALDLPERLRGPGPLLLAQAHSTEVLVDVALRVDADLAERPPLAVVLHHLGLEDERVVELEAADLGSFSGADHLTSVYLYQLRGAGDAVDDLVDLMAELRARCPWDRVQTHGSLARYLQEESYEALDAIEALVRSLDSSEPRAQVDRAARHAEEELGDLLFQIVFHAHLAAEEGLFDLRGVADEVRTKLVARHPHVFGDAVASTPDAVAARWEDLKRQEKGRSSVMDGIPEALPALSLMAKVRRKSLATGQSMPDRAALVAEVATAVEQLPIAASLPDDASIGRDGLATASIGRALEAICDLARLVGVDPEQALRERARAVIALVRAQERDAETSV
ncbi:MAG TPA: MazG nucleotide pyrophosphohydrolase domain-containing protein [Acidimicrobiales bacterium]|nr:MazG nucleotide pyrophosphohydrolase domain-containing protein [Acidimicrobiales bacterium]